MRPDDKILPPLASPRALLEAASHGLPRVARIGAYGLGDAAGLVHLDHAVPANPAPAVAAFSAWFEALGARFRVLVPRFVLLRRAEAADSIAAPDAPPADFAALERLIAAALPETDLQAIEIGGGFAVEMFRAKTPSGSTTRVFASIGRAVARTNRFGITAELLIPDDSASRREALLSVDAALQPWAAAHAAWLDGMTLVSLRLDVRRSGHAAAALRRLRADASRPAGS